MALRIGSDFPSAGGIVGGALILLSTLDVAGVFTVDTINERTGPGGVTIEGVTLNDGALSLPGQLSSTLVTGTAPLVVGSTTNVANLNADLLDGFHESAFGRLAVARTWTALQSLAAGVNVLTPSTLDELDLVDLDATPVANRRLQTIDGLIRASTLLDVEGRFLSRLSLEPITNAEVAAGAGIAYAKLALAGSIVNADLAGGAYPAITGVGTLSTAILSSSPTGGIGYTFGATGNVTQLTSKSTAVVLNRPSGLIQMHAAALAAGGIVSFELTNSAIDFRNVVVICVTGQATSDTYLVGVELVDTGRCRILLQNISGTSRSEAVQLQFAVIRSLN